MRKVASGGVFVTSVLAEQVVQQLNGRRPASDLSGLSNRELEVLQRVVAGERMVDIAEALHLSIKTVSTHKTRILEKLQLDSTAALIRFGLEHRLDKANLGAPPDLG
ncbi:Virulence factors putative positive transcription regulator BvgA [compost metagenome]